MCAAAVPRSTIQKCKSGERPIVCAAPVVVKRSRETLISDSITYVVWQEHWVFFFFFFIEGRAVPESSPRPSKASATAHCEHSVTSAAQGCSCLYLLRITFKSASSSHAFHCKHSEARWPLSSLWLLADQIRCCWPPCLGSPATFFFFFYHQRFILLQFFVFQSTLLCTENMREIINIANTEWHLSLSRGRLADRIH